MKTETSSRTRTALDIARYEGLTATLIEYLRAWEARTAPPEPLRLEEARRALILLHAIRTGQVVEDGERVGARVLRMNGAATTGAHPVRNALGLPNDIVHQMDSYMDTLKMLARRSDVGAVAPQRVHQLRTLLEYLHFVAYRASLSERIPDDIPTRRRVVYR